MSSQLALDTFVRANQSSFGVATDGVSTWHPLSGNATYAILSSKGVVTMPASGNISLASLSSTSTGQAWEIFMSWQTSGTSTPNNHVGVFFDYQDINNYMYFEATSSNVNLHRIVSGTDIVIATVSGNTITANTVYHMRVRWTPDGHYYCKVWSTTSAEPATWTLNAVSDTTYNSGKYGLWTASRSSGSTVTLTQFYVADAPFYEDTDTNSLTLSELLKVNSKQSVSSEPPPPLSVAYNFAGNIISQQYYKYQVAYVYSPDNSTFIDVLRDAPLIAGFTETISSGTSPIRVKLPRSFDFYDQAGIIGSRGTIAQGNVVRYYIFGPGLPSSGLLRYQGFIDTIEPEIGVSGEESVTITLVPFSSVIADHGITQNLYFGTSTNTATYIDPISIFQWFFNNIDPVTGKTYMYPLVWNPSNPTISGITVSYVFSNQTIQSIFDTALLMLPANWYYRINADNSVSINLPNTLADHTLYVGKNISNPQYRIDWSQLRNVVCYKGGNSSGATTGTVSGTLSEAVLQDGTSSGTFAGVVSGTATTGTYSGVAAGSVAGSVTGTTTLTTVPMQIVKFSPSSLATFGERINYYTEARIIDLNTLNVIALGMLTQLNRYTIRTKIRVPDYAGASGMGYPIDSFKVGDSVLIVDPTAPNSQVETQWDIASWDVDAWDFKIGVNLKTSLFDHTLPIVSLTYGFDYVDLELDSLMPNLSRAFKAVQQNFNDFTMGVNATGTATAAQANTDTGTGTPTTTGSGSTTTSGGGTTTTTGTGSTTGGVTPIPNPSKKLLLFSFGDNTSTDPFNLANNKYCSGSNVLLYWTQLEPTTEGTFDWTPLETPLNHWAAKNKQCIVRISVSGQNSSNWYLPYSAQGTPSWVFNAGVKKITGGNGTIVPQYWNPTFQSKMAGFINALATKYDGDSRLAGIQIAVGMGGECKTDSVKYTSKLSVMQAAGYTDALWFQYIQFVMNLYITGFKKTQLIMASDTDVIGGTAGYSQDTTIGYITAQNGKIWIQNDGLVVGQSIRSSLQAAFGKIPVVSEQRNAVLAGSNSGASGDTMAQDLAIANTQATSRIFLVFDQDINNSANASVFDQYVLTF